MSKNSSPSRVKFLLLLNDMPDEAFLWLVLSVAGQRGQIWPDGIGGFQDESQAAIQAARKEAQHLVDNHS